jgi:hypothetical protein
MTDPALSTEPRRPNPRFVVAMIVLSVLLFLIAVGMIGFQWLRTNEPASELLILGNEKLNGGQASVRGVEETTPFTSTFGSGGRYALPFYVYPGAYIVRVTSKEGEVIDERELTIHAKERAVLDFTHWERKIPTSGPSATVSTTTPSSFGIAP